jgi:hypothetical protein
MNFTHYDLGGLGKGRTVEVLLQGNAANVYLLDHENMIKYNKGLPFQAIGGLMTFSPIRMQTIDSAHWHLVVDLPKGYGTVKTSYRVLSKQPPNISTRLASFRPSEAHKKSASPPVASGILSEEKPKSPEKEKPQEPQPTPDHVHCKSCSKLSLRGNFCSECGLPLATEKECPGCSTITPLTVKFCHQCGYKLR